MSAGGLTIDRQDLLLALADEMRDLGVAASQLQQALGEILQGLMQAGMGPSRLWHLQEIDRMQQTLDDLAAILRVAAAESGPRVEVERVAGVVRLGAIRARLQGSERESTAGRDTGAVSMF